MVLLRHGLNEAEPGVDTPQGLAFSTAAARNTHSQMTVSDYRMLTVILV
jgi:hypothetical protein